MTTELLTPFEYTQGQSETVYGFDDYKYNHTPLDLFLLKTKMIPILQDLYGPIDYHYTAVEYENKMRMVIRTNPPIKEQDLVQLSEIVKDLCQNLHEQSIILDLSYNLYNNVFIPMWYINSMVHRIKIQDVIPGVHHIFLDLSRYIHQESDEYLEYYIDVQVNLISIIEKMYQSRYFVFDANEAKEKGYLPAQPIEGYQIDLQDLYIVPVESDLNIMKCGKNAGSMEIVE